MIGIFWILCGVIMIISIQLAKKDPSKLLASKRRKRKANLSDEEYVANVYKNSLTCSIAIIILGVLWIFRF